ncbi:hypothetical protein LR48_Vigan07g131200 [Vigna angularis]|uniref:Uncharacterized protein n=2 Tax=Phaseolus angularis TaxID=3914 RepID=A0A0L9UXW0_PHAAN|nr:hypothetical protein LR48_Vigan07g131200 [Vigna angularis]BAU03270.1 hypothetical protein VIGAN_UM061400 [Vigna angularis var. angularis]
MKAARCATVGRSIQVTSSFEQRDAHDKGLERWLQQEDVSFFEKISNETRTERRSGDDFWKAALSSNQEPAATPTAVEAHGDSEEVQQRPSSSRHSQFPNPAAHPRSTIQAPSSSATNQHLARSNSPAWVRRCVPAVASLAAAAAQGLTSSFSSGQQLNHTNPWSPHKSRAKRKKHHSSSHL